MCLLLSHVSFLTIECCWDQYSWEQIQIRHPYTVFTNGRHAGKSEALKDKQKLQMKTFSELAECLALIPLKITLYGRVFKYNYVGCLQLLMFSTDLLFAIKRDAYIFKETGWFCRFPKHQKLDRYAIAVEKRQTCCQTSHWNRVRKPAHCNSVKQKYKQILVARTK